MTWTWRDIPLSDGDENVHDLHPVVAARVAALCNDPEVTGLTVESGVRTYAEQVHLWNLYQSGHGNTAANPYVHNPTAYGLPYRLGSWHMVQPTTGYGYAVDLAMAEFRAQRGLSQQAAAELVHRVAARYRLAFQVPGEDWHAQPPLSENPLTWVPDDPRHTPTEEEDDMSPELKAELDAIRKEVQGVRDDLTALRRQVSMSSKKPSRTIQQAVGAIADKLGV